MAGVAILAAEEPMAFNRDVRPILSEHCWRCHGPDERARQAGLRLDARAPALLPAESGATAIVPGQPDQSELLSRISSHDQALQMPPPDAPRRLTETEIDTLRQWIAQGANYQRHWSFEPIVSPAVPALSPQEREPAIANPIDSFVVARLQQRGLGFSPEADPATLLRRVSFDLTGLPPTPDDLRRCQEGSESYQQAVDRLLASPHFGERMAVDWLDAARYADTDGYFGDKPRQMWLWRDWVIAAFNANMPFDQFTVEQLAGDLLPGATTAQRIATGFNRNHMSNDETGIIDEEYRVEYVVDRVETTTAAWLGLTVGCAQCHGHKYDPISQREYYQLFAFFNNVPEQGLLLGSNAPPRISVPSPEQQRQLAESSTAAAEAASKFAPLKETAAAELAAREDDVLSSLPPLPGDALLHETFDSPAEESLTNEAPRRIGTTIQTSPGIRGQAGKFDATQHLEFQPPSFSADGPWTIGLWLAPDSSLGCLLSKIEPEGDRRGLEVLWQKGRCTVNLVHQWGTNAVELVTRHAVSSQQWHQLVVAYDGSRQAAGLLLYIDGQPAAVDIRRDALSGTIHTSQPLRIGRRDEGLGYYGLLDEPRILAAAISPAEAAGWYRGERLRGVLEIAADQRSANQAELLLDDYIDTACPPETRQARDAVRQISRAVQQLRDAIPLALVMDELSPPRPTHILDRGQYDKPGAPVQPAVPAALSPWPANAPRNRLGFAQWLVAADNPLTARVAANRLWRQCFGEGLVRTVNDFGTQGEPPTHPELLDYLAAEFRDNGWNVKRLLRLIVTSQTYRQDSRYALQQGEVIDPDNLWLARGPSFRLPMEMIRDQALAASGLLVPRLGGPSVKPYQPPGLWEEVSYNAEASYEPDQDDGRWRRSLYTFVKRQAPPPALLLLDGPTREKCTLRRPRTNTPLQALLLLNDETYIEAARVLAANTLAEPEDDTQRLHRLCRQLLSRPVLADEADLLLALLRRQRQRFADDPTAVEELLAAGLAPRDERLNTAELAAWTVLAHTLLNLDEAITRQ
ncbi:MAG: DUF1553 domain-containing protein [Pirellulales bacterium]